MAGATVKKLRTETNLDQEENRTPEPALVVNEFEDFEEASDVDDREAKIAELAYFKAERRGFEPGYELADWFEAVQEVDSPKEGG
ncbi:MAG: DUF2934 domain-containing protein, partial [Methylosarcina sp.]